MKKWSMTPKVLLGVLCIFAATIANGTASYHYSFQPKEPENLNDSLKEKR